MYTKTGRQHWRSDATIRSKNNEDAEKKIWNKPLNSINRRSKGCTMWNIGTSLEVLKEGFIRKSNRILSKQPICPSCKEQYPYNKPESPRYKFFPGTWIYMQYRKEGKRNRISPLTTSPICRLILQKFVQVCKTTGQVISRIVPFKHLWSLSEDS